MGGIPRLVGIAAPPAPSISSSANGANDVDRSDVGRRNEPPAVRKKAIYALSSAVRNYQPAMDVAVEELGKRGHSYDKIDANDMEAVDGVIEALRATLPGSGQATS